MASPRGSSSVLWILGLLLVAGACRVDKVLDVQNPQEIPIDAVNDPKLLEVRLNGVVDAFTGTYVGSIVQYANFVTDELVTGLNFEDYARANQRIVSWLEGPTTQIFEVIREAAGPLTVHEIRDRAQGRGRLHGLVARTRVHGGVRVAEGLLDGARALALRAIRRAARRSTCVFGNAHRGEVRRDAGAAAS